MKHLIEYKMKSLHIRQEQMAKAFCISLRTWRNWMNCPEHLTAERLREIGDILHMTDEEFLKMARYEKWK